jgi:hypothetical protein
VQDTLRQVAQISYEYAVSWWAGITLAIWRLATGGTARGLNPGGGGGARFSAPFQTSPEAHPAFYRMDTVSFPGGKAAEAWHWQLTPSRAEVKERV